MAKGMILRRGGGTSGGLPTFAYTGNYTLIDDGDKNWRIKFLGSGTFTPGKDITIDACAVGGGGGANKRLSANATGGCGGFTTNQTGVVLSADTPYEIVIGAGGAAATVIASGTKGGTSSAFGLSALGGDGGAYSTSRYGGSGGAGIAGSPGVDGANGTGESAGNGQGTTTREFGEQTGTLYSTGGYIRNPPSAKAPNTGDGGDAHALADSNGTAGASGIVVIRNHRA
jgi:hypothetical protein